ncbi:MAG: putative O-glycosylation ligase, exosortase A system-associated [Gammaproteobacteria bacterium]
MRDLIVTLIVLGSLPYIFTRPHLGAFMWAWISYMNPHRMGWGFAYSMPFAALIAACTLLAFVTNPNQRRGLPMYSNMIWMLALVFWFNVTSVFAYDHKSWSQWDKVMKIQLLNLVTIMVCWGRERITILLAVITGSIAFYGFKGGIFTVLTAGGAKVWGPKDSYIEGNNELALALICCIPILLFLRTQYKNKWVGYLILATIFLCGISAIGSYSRGALLAIAAMLGWLWVKSQYKFKTGIAIVLAAPLVLMMMPDRWFDRMNTIDSYEEDRSAMGRISAWWYAWNAASDKPLEGLGFRGFHHSLFPKYSPYPDMVHDAHSIYFKILGEHGFVGLSFYLLMAFSTFFMCRWIVKKSRGVPELAWAASLGAMVEVSLVGFATGGAFLGLSYWDWTYHIVGIVALTKREVVETLQKLNTAKASALPPMSGAPALGTGPPSGKGPPRSPVGPPMPQPVLSRPPAPLAGGSGPPGGESAPPKPGAGSAPRPSPPGASRAGIRDTKTAGPPAGGTSPRPSAGAASRAIPSGVRGGAKSESAPGALPPGRADGDRASPGPSTTRPSSTGPSSASPSASSPSSSSPGRVPGGRSLPPGFGPMHRKRH